MGRGPIGAEAFVFLRPGAVADGAEPRASCVSAMARRNVPLRP